MRTLELDSATNALIEHTNDSSLVLTFVGKPYTAIVPCDEESVEALLRLVREEDERDFDAEIEAFSNHPNTTFSK